MDITSKPCNLCGSEFDYSIVKCDGEYYIMATALYEKAMEAAGKAEYEVVASLKVPKWNI